MGLKALDRVRINAGGVTATVLEMKVIKTLFDNVDIGYKIRTDDGTIYEDVRSSALTKLHKVTVEEILELQRQIERINNLRLDDLDLTFNGLPFKVSDGLDPKFPNWQSELPNTQLIIKEYHSRK